MEGEETAAAAAAAAATVLAVAVAECARESARAAGDCS